MVSGVIVICSEITDWGKSEQNPASCYYLLVVKLVVKGERVTTKDCLLKKLLYLLTQQPKFYLHHGKELCKYSAIS